MKEFETLSKAMRNALNKEMQTVLKVEETTPDLFYGMLHYHMGWCNRALQPAQVNAGKQIRPVLLLLVCQAAGGDWQQAVPAAAAVELLHNFSLIHDDIEDASPTRRGQETLWQIWGVAQAINAGDAMFALAHMALNRLYDRGVSADKMVRALRRFDETSVYLTRGQHADMRFEEQALVSVNDYIAMITGKTAVLLSLCAELGALVAGQDDKTITHYAQFGLNAGLAFQVIDDILGIWGDESLIGKSASTDIVTKKKTLPVLYGLENNAKLRHLYAQQNTDQAFVSEVVAQLNETGARDFAIAKAAGYTQSALGNLEAAHPTGPAYTALNQLTDMLLRRDF